MIDLAAMILVAVGTSHFFEIFEESWIYKIVRVSNRVHGCWQKTNKVVLMALEILNVISQQRTDQQVLQFLKHFNEFIMDNNFSHINFDERLMNNTFKNLFTTMQFNINVKGITALMLMLDPTMKIILDP